MKKSIKDENFLERIPQKSSSLNWSQNENGRVTLEIANEGFFNRIAQKLFGKPPVTYIHLDDVGSFVWTLIDGNSDIIVLGEKVKEHFKDAAEPLYERLAKFFTILESYRFIIFK